LNEYIHYEDEKNYLTTRLIMIIGITFFSFVSIEQIQGKMASDILLVSFVLTAVSIISLVHYSFVISKKKFCVDYRKQFLILLDIGVLTFTIGVYKHYGLFFFPLYFVIIIQSGLTFGIFYTYVGMFLAFLSWGFLLFLSPYWLANYDIVATFAITTLIVPIFYLKYIIEIHTQKDELEKVLYTTEYAANFDSLTNVPNRKMFKETLKSAIEEKEPFILLLIDLNKFKSINDNCGHNVGDEVLKEVTRRINNYIDEDDFLARLGGDEFVIILKQKRAFLNNFLKKMEKNIMGKYKASGAWVDIQLSVGVSLFPEDGHHEKTLLDNADKAMYVAKKDFNTYFYLYKDIPPNENY